MGPIVYDARLIVGACAALCGVCIVILNARVAIQTLRGKHAPSWTPLLGGVLLATGLAVLPFDCPLWLVPIPLIVDPGCLPGLVWTAGWYLFSAASQRDDCVRAKR